MFTSILIYFVILLSIIVVCLGAIIARQRPSWAINLSIGYVVALLIFLGAIALNLPVRIDGITWSVGRSDMGWPLLVDHVSWRLSLFLLVISLTALLLYKRRSVIPTDNIGQNRAHWVAMPIQTLLIFFSLIAVWSDSFFGFANSIVGSIICWYIFLSSIGHPRAELRNVLLRGSNLLLGVGFFGFITIFQPTSMLTLSQTAEWNLSAVIFIYLTGLIFILTIPIQIWRSIDRLPGESTSLLPVLLLTPATLGCLIIARISIFQFQSSTYPILFTVIGLTCLLAGVSLAWLNINRTGRLLAAFIIAESGLVLIVAVWTNQMATVAQGGVLILATGATVLFTGEQREKFNWPMIIPALALAGFPFTLGFTSMRTLYDTWLEGGGLTLVVVTALLYIPLIALVLRTIKGSETVNKTERSDRFMRILEVGGLVLLMLALITIPIDVSIKKATIPLIGIIFSSAGGFLLFRYVNNRDYRGNEFRNALRIHYPIDQINELVRRFWRVIHQFICEISAVLEGEGGMMWVLILIVILWIART